MHPRNMTQREPVHICDDHRFILPQTPQGVLSLFESEDWRWMIDPYGEWDLWSVITVSEDYIRVVNLAHDIVHPAYHVVRVYLIKSNGSYKTKNIHYFKAPEYSIKKRPTKIRLI